MRVVIDTNILVSALLTPAGNPAKILDHALNGTVVLCYDSRVISEYQEVLQRPKFGFDKKAVKLIVEFVIHSGISLVPTPIFINFDDEDDKKFYEVAKSVNAYLVTGNIKHFPKERLVVTPQEFLNILESGT